MAHVLRIAFTALLFLHGLVHLLGTAVYLQFVEISEFPYKTTLLGGHWEVGATGAWAFGLLWLGAAVGFVIAAATFILEGPSHRTILLGVTLFSLVLTVLDWGVAYAGVVVNIGILAVLVVLWRL